MWGRWVPVAPVRSRSRTRRVRFTNAPARRRAAGSPTLSALVDITADRAACSAWPCSVVRNPRRWHPSIVWASVRNSRSDASLYPRSSAAGSACAAQRRASSWNWETGNTRANSSRNCSPHSSAGAARAARRSSVFAAPAIACAAARGTRPGDRLDRGGGQVVAQRPPERHQTRRLPVRDPPLRRDPRRDRPGTLQRPPPVGLHHRNHPRRDRGQPPRQRQRLPHHLRRRRALQTSRRRSRSVATANASTAAVRAAMASNAVGPAAAAESARAVPVPRDDSSTRASHLLRVTRTDPGIAPKIPPQRSVPGTTDIHRCVRSHGETWVDPASQQVRRHRAVHSTRIPRIDPQDG